MLPLLNKTVLVVMVVMGLVGEEQEIIELEKVAAVMAEVLKGGKEIKKPNRNKYCSGIVKVRPYRHNT